jgi:hypothetical protein
MEGRSYRRTLPFVLVVISFCCIGYVLPGHRTLVFIVFVGFFAVISWVEKWSFRRRFKLDATCATLGPNEQAMVPVEISLRVNDMVRRGGILSFQFGPDVDDGGGNFHRNIYILIDAVRQDTFRQRWKVKG